MEENKKSGPLLAAVILGVLGILVWCFFESNFIKGLKQANVQSGFTMSLLFNIDAWKNGAGGDGLLIIYLLFIAPISLLAALVLNVLGWLKNDAKKTLVAGIVYVLSVLGIPSAILCFIGRAKLKKQQA